ncbi:ANTAR domain-containing protein [Kineococcus sp. TBRC 1896]|uniref:ANTAR domain-containing protein n=1 Tax=Kineococcus mangrovi TaxID=1660183 RepID=A0ABV4I9X0_9ACTN
MTFSICSRTRAGVVTVEVRGDLDLTTAHSAHLCLTGAVHDGHTVVVDLSRVPFVDCAAVSVLLAAARDASRRGGYLVLAEARPVVRLLLDALELTPLLGGGGTVAQEQAAALAASAETRAGTGAGARGGSSSEAPPGQPAFALTTRGGVSSRPAAIGGVAPPRAERLPWRTPGGRCPERCARAPPQEEDVVPSDTAHDLTGTAGRLRGTPGSDTTGDRRSSHHRQGAPVSELASRFGDLARQLRRQETPQQVMDRIAEAAVSLVPGADQATISRARRHQRVTSAAATSEQAAGFDTVQTEVGQGPCLDALFEARTIRVEDLAGEVRWPDLARHADEVQVRSALCFQLYVDGDNLGALNLLSPRASSFDDESEDIGAVLASHAAVAVADAQDLANVRIALDSRDLIGQAKGILMARHRLTADQAFAVLTRFSQDTNRKLRDVAWDVAATGTLDDVPR